MHTYMCAYLHICMCAYIHAYIHTIACYFTHIPSGREPVRKLPVACPVPLLHSPEDL